MPLGVKYVDVSFHLDNHGPCEYHYVAFDNAVTLVRLRMLAAEGPAERHRLRKKSYILR